MRFFLSKIIFLLVLICDVSAITVETLDEQVNSSKQTALRLRINNETGKNLYDINVRFFVQKGRNEFLVVEEYDLGGARARLDSLRENIWVLTISVDTLPPGIYPYESGICLGIHDVNWQERDKSLDPSYIASSIFVNNSKVEVNVDGNHLPDAVPVALVSGTKMLIDEGDPIPFAWHRIPNAEKYRLRVFTTDTQLVYQKETYENRESVALGAGDYLWQVEAKNSGTGYSGAGAGGLLNYLTIDYFGSVVVRDSMSHNIRSVSGHKDTPMLVVGWGEYADLREWDRPHLGRTFLDEIEDYSCWAIAIKNLNQLYEGNLLLDEIIWRVKSNGDSVNAFRFLLNAEASYEESKIGLKYALDSLAPYENISYKEEPLTFDKVKDFLAQNQEILIKMTWPNTTSGHIMLIDSYFMTDDGDFVRCVNVDNLGNNGVFLADSLFKAIGWYIIIDKPESVRNMSPLLGVENNEGTIEWTDSDNDGITDFDEIYRFRTNPNLDDSDSDRVKDKDEIHSYTILEKGSLDLRGSYVGMNIDLTQMRFIAGVQREYMADVDGDGKRAELDPDSDNDGILDGDDPEPYKVNVFKDSMDINELPKDVVLYVRKQLNVNDGTACESNLNRYCMYASEGTDSEYGMIMGARVAPVNLYARNKILIRSNDNTFAVNYYGSSDLTTVRPDGKATIERHFDDDEWPWKLDIKAPSFDEGDSVLVVQRGDTCFLRDDIHLKKLKVESGGVVYLPTGKVYVGDLQLDSGGKVGFENQARNTILYVKRRIIWRSKFIYKANGQFSYEPVAAKFKLIYSGVDRVFFDVNWFGSIIAPNAEIVLGQTHEKKFFGQFFADKITVHQYTQLKNIPFEFDRERVEYVFSENKQKNNGGKI